MSATDVAAVPERPQETARLATRPSGTIGAFAERVLARDWIVLAALLVVAGLTRLPGLAQRAEFDGDQGHDVLTLLRFTQDGVFPLLGPPTSIGDFHHGAFYYLLLAPVAAAFNSDPVAIVTAIAVMGVLAVGVTWWVARSIAGPVAGLVAGAILAVSPAAIDESIFIWNPNPIPLFAALSLACAWQAYRSGRSRWWVPALLCAGIVFQLHVLGIVFLPPILGLLIIDWRRARAAGDARQPRRVALAGLAGLALIAALFIPLAIHELQNDFSETRNAIAYFTSSAKAPATLGPVERVLFTLFRIVGWPLVGLVTNAPIGAAIGVALTATFGIWAAAIARGPERTIVRWLVATVVWATLALAVLAPSLQTVVAGLPNDHYHAYLDPIVAVLLGISVVVVGRAAARPPVVTGAIRAVAVAGLAAVLAVAVTHWPAAVDANGGWPAAEAAGARVVALTGTDPVLLVDVPDFKTPEGIGLPIVWAGGSFRPTGDSGSSSALGLGTAPDVARTSTPRFIVVDCDRLFEPVVGVSCGGPAEDAAAMRAFGAGLVPAAPTLVTRFDLSPRTSISIYRESVVLG